MQRRVGVASSGAQSLEVRHDAAWLIDRKLFRDGVIKRAPAGKVRSLTTNATELSERLVVLIRRKLLLPTLHALVAEDGKKPAKKKR